jgi:hypothetical protein
LIELIYRIGDRDTARALGITLDETFHPDQLTGLNFLVRPDGETVVIAVFAPATDRIYLVRAHALLQDVGEALEIGLRDLLATAREQGFNEFYLGDDAVRFLSVK